MRILITGVTGQVGSALMESLRSCGTLVPADRTTLDLSKPNEIASRLDSLQPDLVINPAAYTAVDRAEDERDLAFVINGESPGVIARWAAKRAIPLVHFSTDYIFDGGGERPWREDDPAGPLNTYGASKLACEQAVRSAGGHYLIVRTSLVYAARGTNFLRTIARLAGEREQLRIVADQIGAPTSAACISDTLAQIVRQALPDIRIAFDRAGHVVNIAASGETSWHGFAQAIIAGLRRRGLPVKARSIIPIATKDHPTKALRPANSRLDLSRLRDTFAVVPPHWDVLLEREITHLATGQNVGTT